MILFLLFTWLYSKSKVSISIVGLELLKVLLFQAESKFCKNTDIKIAFLARIALASRSKADCGR